MPSSIFLLSRDHSLVPAASQVWKDLDPRRTGRFVVIERVAGDFAYVRETRTGNPSRIHVSRMRASKTRRRGYEAVETSAGQVVRYV